MCPLAPSIPPFAPGRKLSTSDRNVLDSVRALLAHLEAFGTSKSSFLADSGSFEASCLLPLNPSQSHYLADLVTILVPRSTWWSIQERSDSWAMCGKVGGDSGPQVTVFISATSDRDVAVG